MPKYNKTVDGKILKIYKTLSSDDGRDLIYAQIQWDDRPPKDEIRIVWTDSSGSKHLGKGVALSRKESMALKEALQSRNFEEDCNDTIPEVNFSDIFEEAKGIAKIRANGNATKDGFVVLSYKDGVNPKTLKNMI